MALMEGWMDTTHTFHLPFDEMMITTVDFVAITRLPFGGQSVVFDDQLRNLDRQSFPSMEVQLKVCIHNIENLSVLTTLERPNLRMGCHCVPVEVAFPSWFILRHVLPRADVAAAQRGLATTDHLATFVPDAYAIFQQQQQHGKRVRGSSNSRVVDIVVVVDKLEHGPGASFSLILDFIGQPAQGMLETHLVSITDYNEVSQLYEATRLKLTMARLSDEHVSRVSMVPPAGRGRGAQRGGHAG
ncbi:hypothetical protein JCGZ_18238 [Jatropha curcas]|uniref:Aminotransferase-like plant mobile domain-containing protein n=1 Tax=Jatropha curcas TaxID=180498 RepID=A0A067K1L1_JATCU|nr:hypothetical protein JCGZ_18238 [Jatropha curcas]